MAAAKTKSYLGGVFFSLLLIGAYLLFIYHGKIFASNVSLKGKKQVSVYIPTGADFNDFKTLINLKHFLINESSFWWVAKLKDFDTPKAGHYVIRSGMSNNELVNMFRGGLQTPVKLRVPSMQVKANFAGRMSRQIEADSLSIIRMLYDDSFLSSQGFDVFSVMGAFIPDTYEVYWNMDAEDFFAFMKKQYDAYWNETRRQRAVTIGLTPNEVSTLASIVQAEQSRFNDEKPTIAGLYINRLRTGMPLQSDPTLVFAKQNFGVQRVLNADKRVLSPYNTYKNKGLPPGPINMPNKSSLDAVLHYQANNYTYMCAKEDLSGRHYFTNSYAVHKENAKKYQQALDQRGIKR